MRSIGLGVAVVVFATTAAGADINIIQSSQAGDEWTSQAGLTWGNDFPSYVDVTVERGQRGQEILGFGAAFTDTSAYNVIEFMTNETRQQYLESMWGKSGLGLSVGRVHINSPDYAFETYNLDNVTDDFALAHFDTNLTYDSQRVIPYIRAAKALSTEAWGNDIRLFASPWSPPAWLKVNNNMINSALPCLKNDTAAGQSYRATWADYIVMWLDTWAAHGLPMWGLTPQNEPMAQQAKFESCAYTIPAYLDFIGNYLGPRMRAAQPNVSVLMYDHNKLAALEWAAAVYSNPAVAQYVDGVALHWYDYTRSLALGNVAAINALMPNVPNKTLLATEACYLSSLAYNWSTGELYIADILGDLNNGVQGWTAWNSVLLTGDKYPFWRGGPNHDNTTVFGDPVLFEYNATGTQRLILQSSYWILGHLSRFARPGSFWVRSGGAGVASTPADYDAVRAAALGQAPYASLSQLLAVSFVSHDDANAVVVVANPTDAAITFKLRDVPTAGAGSGAGVRAAQDTIPAHAIRTYTYAIGSASATE